MGYNRTLGHFTNSQELATIWASGQNYIVDQLVLNNDILYRCNTAHTSGATFSGDSAYWTGINPGSTITIAQGGTGQTTKTEAFDALSPTTTAGDLIVYNGTDNVRLPVGSDGQAIVADATSPNKLKWGNVAITSGGTGQNNKTDAFDALAPTTTAGDLIVYNGTDNVRLPVGTDGQMIIADSSQTNKLKWANVPQGSKNYITFSNFENNATTGWSLFNTTLTSKIPTGSITAGAASLNALAVTASTPLAGLYSLIVTSPAAVSAGQGFITDALPIDREDQAKVLTFSFYYEVISGVSNMNFSGTSSNTWAVYIAEVNPATPDTVINWIQPAGVYGMTQSTGTGLVTGTFQTSSTGAAYRVAVVCVTASAGAISMEFDDFKLGPQTAPIGPVVTDWVNYTPTFTGFGTPTNVNVRSRRVGSDLEIEGYFQTGSNTGTTAQVSLGFSGGNANVTIDTTRITTNAVVGRVGHPAQSNLFYGAYVLATGANNFLNFSFQSSTANNLNAVGGSFFLNNAVIQFNAKVPIQGWSSNVQTSDSTDTRVVAFRATNSISRTMSFPFTSPTVAIFETVENDTHGAYSTANGLYRVPVSGFYRITHHFLSNSASFTAGQSLGSWVQKNGSNHSLLAVYRTPVASNTIYEGSGSTVIFCNAGDTLACALYSDVATTSYSGAPTTNYLSIERLSGPSVIAATENVIAKYQTVSNTVGSTATLITYGTKEIDSHGIYNTSTGVITIPISGKYLIGIYGTTGTTPTPNWTANQQFLWQLRKNGSIPSPALVVTQIRAQTTWNSGVLETMGNTYIECLAGDTFEIMAQNSLSQPLSATSGRNYFYIVRIGN